MKQIVKISANQIFINTLKITLNAILALSISFFIYATLIDTFDKKEEKKIEIKMEDVSHLHDKLLDLQVRKELGLSSTNVSPINELTIIKYLKDSDRVISAIYILIYLVLSFEIFVFLDKFRKKKSKDVIETITSINVTIAPTLGTMGTLYALGLGVSNSKYISSAIKSSFYDAIYTTLIGLSVSIICLILYASYYYISNRVSEVADE